MKDDSEVLSLLAEAKVIARRYRVLTGKPLGITGEIAEYEAARILGLDLAPARTAGYDATEIRDGTLRKIQIKGRCLLPGCKPGQRLGSIDVSKEFDSVLLVVLDENLDASEMFEVFRAEVLVELSKPGSKARNERGALAVSSFKKLAGAARWKRL
ncbi:MAG: hypothetical protein KDB53_17920 [Planctomycetes bacterium]|nr:hypothetical protein [Planctomycetota bacterium]